MVYPPAVSVRVPVYLNVIRIPAEGLNFDGAILKFCYKSRLFLWEPFFIFKDFQRIDRECTGFAVYL